MDSGFDPVNCFNNFSGTRPAKISPLNSTGHKGVSSARSFTYFALRRIEEDLAYSSHLLASKQFSVLSAVERRFAHELLLGVLRRQSTLDWVLHRFLDVKIKKLHPALRRILRIGTYQLLFMDRSPAFAAVSESVNLCRTILGSKPSGLVNAILRKISREIPSWNEYANQWLLEDTQSISIRYSHPEWLVSRWMQRYGLPLTLQILEKNNHSPRRDFYIPHDNPDIRAQLERAILQGEIQRLDFPEGAYCLRDLSRPLEKTGNFVDIFPHLTFQARTSQCVPYLLPVAEKDSVLDACAAPGGKTRILARRIGCGGSVLAVDLHPHRLQVMRSLIGRSDGAEIFAVCADSSISLPLRQECSFSSVLVDAPCSGLGTLCRNPEIRWRIQPDDLSNFQERQLQILSSTSQRVRPGGHLLYSTCSTEPEENESVVSHFLKGNDRFQKDTISLPLQEKKWLNEDGFFRSYPFHYEEDGFFAALLRRIS